MAPGFGGGTDLVVNIRRGIVALEAATNILAFGTGRTPAMEARAQGGGDEAWRIAVNIARLPELLTKP